MVFFVCLQEAVRRPVLPAHGWRLKRGRKVRPGQGDQSQRRRGGAGIYRYIFDYPGVFDDRAFASQNPSVVPVAPPPTAFAQSLLSAEGEEELAAALEGLKGLGPAKVETEIR